MVGCEGAAATANLLFRPLWGDFVVYNRWKRTGGAGCASFTPFALVVYTKRLTNPGQMSYADAQESQSDDGDCLSGPLVSEAG